MKRLWTILAILALTTAHALAADFFVRYSVQGCEDYELLTGDSCLVTVTVYSDLPFSDVECTKEPHFKGAASVRTLRQYREKTQQRQMVEGRVYYAVRLSQVVVAAPEKKGEIVMKGGSYKAQFLVYDEEPDFFDEFFGRQPKHHYEKGTAKGEDLKIKIIAPPPVTTQELLKRGGNIM